MIVSTDYAADPKHVATWASAILAADKGIPSEVKPNNLGGYDVVTDEGKVCRFLPNGAKR